MTRFYIEHPRLQASTDEVQQKVKETLDLYGVKVTKVCVNGVYIDGYIQFSEMEEIVNLLREICG
jgi:enamine deaminase RidA (YjgF/YER057c/UK114 family)